MKLAIDILKARHIGIRDLKEHLSKNFLNEVLVITDRGNPISVNLPYSDLLELIDILDELSDADTIEAIQEGRKAIRTGVEGIPVSNLFAKIKSKRK